MDKGLEDENILKAFLSFNVELFTVESVLFYEDVKRYASLPVSSPEASSPAALAEKLAHEARRIFHTYIEVTSPLEINIPADMRHRIQTRLAEAGVIVPIDMDVKVGGQCRFSTPDAVFRGCIPPFFSLCGLLLTDRACASQTRGMSP